MSGILTRFPCSANKNACPIARVAHLPQKPCYSVVYMHALFLARKKTSPAQLNAKQKKPWFSISFDFIARKKYRTIGLVARIVPTIYILVTIYHNCVHFLSKIYILILPQSEVIVKRKIFRGFGRILGVWLPFGFRVSNFVGIRRNFLAGKFQYIPCICFHVMLLLSYRICMNQSTRASSEMEKKYG